MNPRMFIAGAAFAVAVGMTSVALAGANDYAFEPVSVEVKKSDNAVVAVRLVHKPTGKPVSDAVIVRTKIDMGPDGMAEMAPPLTAVPSTEPGVYAFETELSMAGRWLFSIAARVQGEPEIVIGKIIFKATR